MIALPVQARWRARRKGHRVDFDGQAERLASNPHGASASDGPTRQVILHTLHALPFALKLELIVRLSRTPVETRDAAHVSAVESLRMLNEFVCCPRLFYYEHVEGAFVHNAHARCGAEQHKPVDRGTGAPPACTLPSKTRSRVRSLWVTLPISASGCSCRPIFRANPPALDRESPVGKCKACN